MNPTDQGARYAAKQLDSDGFLRWLLPEAFPHRRWTSWLDTQRLAFPGESERRCDCVAVLERMALDAPPVAAVIEFMSRPRGDSPERLAEYAIRIRREVPFHVDPLVRFEAVPVLVNLTGPPQADEWRMTPEDFGGLGLSQRMKVITLRDQEARALLTAIAAGPTARTLLPWVPLMRGADEASVVEEWCRLALAETDARRRADYGGLARVFAELADRTDIWRPKLEGWNVEESQAVKEWQAKARDEERRKIRGTQQSRILATLKARWNAEPPADVIAVVKAEGDLDVLLDWYRLAIESPDLAAFRTGVGLK